MTRTLSLFALAGALAFGQQPATEGVTPRSTTERPNTSAPGLEKTLTGILMDASCQAIASTRSPERRDLSASTGDLTTRSRAAERQDGTTGANAQSLQGETARTTTEIEKREARVGAPDRASAAGTTGAAAETGGATDDPSLRNGTQNQSMPRLTESGQSAATAGPSQASATGTTGAAVETTPPQSGNLQDTPAVQGPGAPDHNRASSRARQAEQRAGMTTVRERYRGCQPTATTTAFALHADGELYVLDRASNEMVREQMRNEAFRASMSNGSDGSRWMTVTMVGTPTSDNTLTIRSVRK